MALGLNHMLFVSSPILFFFSYFFNSWMGPIVVIRSIWIWRQQWGLEPGTSQIWSRSSFAWIVAQLWVINKLLVSTLNYDSKIRNVHLAKYKFLDMAIGWFNWTSKSDNVIWTFKLISLWCYREHAIFFPLLTLPSKYTMHCCGRNTCLCSMAFAPSHLIFGVLFFSLEF